MTPELRNANWDSFHFVDFRKFRDKILSECEFLFLRKLYLLENSTPKCWAMSGWPPAGRTWPLFVVDTDLWAPRGVGLRIYRAPQKIQITKQARDIRL